MRCKPDCARLRVLAAAVLGFAALLGASGDAAETAAQQNRTAAFAALAGGDGVAAQIELERALAAGASRGDVAAAMGEALLAQDDLDAARDWLGPQRFATGQEGAGFRALGVLERRSGHYPEAGQAFDRALRFIPRDPRLWTEIARLRHAGGEHAEAFEAAARALALGPNDVAALRFNALLIRDAKGGAAALPMFVRARAGDPANPELLADYAATLADLGRAGEAVEQARQLFAQHPGNGAASFTQAVIAARADRIELARELIYAAGDRLPKNAATALLRAILELQAGNPNTAASTLGELADRQPANTRIQLLLARSMLEAGDDGGVIARFGQTASRPEAPRYLKVVVARALENRGQRVGAASLIDLPDAGSRPMILAPAGVTPLADIRSLAAAGDSPAAQRAAEAWLTARPGMVQARNAAGDAALLAGDNVLAADHYRAVLAIRQPAGAAAGLRLACRRGGGCDPAALAGDRLVRFPYDLAALADLAALTGDPGLARNLARRTGTLDKR